MRKKWEGYHEKQLAKLKDWDRLQRDWKQGRTSEGVDIVHVRVEGGEE